MAGMDVAGDIVRFHNQWRDAYTGLRPMAKTVVVLPDDDMEDSGEERYADMSAEYKGL